MSVTMCLTSRLLTCAHNRHEEDDEEAWGTIAFAAPGVECVGTRWSCWPEGTRPLASFPAPRAEVGLVACACWEEVVDSE